MFDDEEKPRVFRAPSITRPVIPDIVNALDVEPAAVKVMSFTNAIVVSDTIAANSSASVVTTTAAAIVGSITGLRDGSVEGSLGAGEGPEVIRIGATLDADVGSAVW